MNKSNKGGCRSFEELLSEYAEPFNRNRPQFTHRVDPVWVDDIDPELDEDDPEDDYVKSEHELFAEYYPIKPENADW